MLATRSIADAKAHFAEIIATAEAGEPVVITRHGTPVAVILPATDLEFVQRLREDSPQAGLAGLPTWDDLDDWADDVERIAAARPSPSPGPPLD